MHATHGHAAVPREVRSRLEESVKAAGLDTRVITKTAERALVGKAVEAGLAVEYAQNVIAAIAQEKGYVREAELDRVLLVVLREFAKANGGKLDKGRFDAAVAIGGDLAHEGIPVPALQRIAKQLMIDQGIAAESGGLFHADWFKAIEAAATSPWQQYKDEHQMF